MSRPIRIAVYGDVDQNVVDGSTVWLASLIETLQLGSRISLTVLMRAPERRDLVSGPLRALPRVELVDPAKFGFDRLLRQPEALDLIEKLDGEDPFDAVFIRGFRLAKEASGRARLQGRLWTYLTDIQDPGAVSAEDLQWLRGVAQASRHLLCQTEDLRSHLEALLPEFAGGMILLPPMIPSAEVPRERRPGEGGWRLFYAGKFAPRWGFLEMVEVFEKLRSSHPDLEFQVAGDKVHDPPEAPWFAPEVRRVLEATGGLIWHGGIPRSEVARLLAEMDLALSVRDRELDASLELSTKVLEYGSAGLPVLLNRTLKHERLLGEDYPLFTTLDELPEVLCLAIEDPDVWRLAAERCRAAAPRFHFTEAYSRLEPYLERLKPAATLHLSSGRPIRVALAGHDFRFFEPVQRHLEATGAEVREDRWTGHDQHEEARSRELRDWADLVVCEWCLGNAAWYSAHKREGQKLVIHFHRMELMMPYAGLVEMAAVDAVVFVGSHLEEAARDALAWPELRSRVIPNPIDVVALDREKLPASQFTMGLLGYSPRRKGLDVALDVLELVRAEDARFHLSVKGADPRAQPWIWKLEEERRFYEAQLGRIAESPLLGNAVSFEEAGPNVASWLRKVGFILSTSDDESFHVALAEGMASRAVPAIREWEGADVLYPVRWVHGSAESAARAVLEAVHDGSWEEQGGSAREFVAEHYAREKVVGQWEELIRSLLER